MLVILSEAKNPRICRYPRQSVQSAVALSLSSEDLYNQAMPSTLSLSAFRLRKHADYQRVYQASRKQFSRQMSYFYTLRPAPDSGGPRIGLTVGKVMGKAVDRNRIKRRMREAVRRNLATLLDAPVDVILHPRRSVIDLDFAVLDREIATVFRAIQKATQKQQTEASASSNDQTA